MTTHYNGSKGSMLISDMEPRYLKNALAKLRRERLGDERDGEIAALAAQDAINDAAWLAANPPAEDVKPGYQPGDDVVLWNDSDPFTPDADPRLAIGGNNPPPEVLTVNENGDTVSPADDVAKHWSALAITLRNTKPIGDLEKVKADAAAITAVADAQQAEAAGKVIVDLRRVRQFGTDAFTKEKAPILAASKVCDEFGRPFKSLETEQQRVERLLGGYQQKVAADARKALANAAAAQKAKADELLAAAAQQETAGNAIVGDILMDHAQKAEGFAAIQTERAAAPMSELGKTQTDSVSLGVRAPWTAEIVNATALREASGVLGLYLASDALLTAAKAYVRANVADGKFTGADLPGVRIFQDIRGSARG